MRSVDTSGCCHGHDNRDPPALELSRRKFMLAASASAAALARSRSALAEPAPMVPLVTIRRIFLVCAISIVPFQLLAVSQQQDPLEAAFQAPPGAAQPRVWWHWMNGNVTLAGIRADFEWMRRIGIGGVQNFDIAFNTPQIVPRLAYLTPEWRSMFRQTVALADRLGLELAIAASPGFSETGGPWVEPGQAMKKLVWSETRIPGGRRFRKSLAAPSAVSGPFGNIPADGGAPHATPSYYRDQAVIAYRAPDGDVTLNDKNPLVTSSNGKIDASMLADGDLVEAVSLPHGANGAASWIQFEFAGLQTARALSFVAHRPQIVGPFRGEGPPGRLEASDDGLHFRSVTELPMRGAEQLTVAFPATTARFFRISFEPDRADGFNETLRKSKVVALIRPPPPPGSSHRIAEVVLHGGARIDRFEDKGGFSAQAGIDQTAPLAVGREALIPRSDIIDLTGRMQPDGLLDWSPPNGQWIVLRFGYSLIGRLNHPASAEGTGLEVDKLNRDHVKKYIDAYLGEYEATLGSGLMGRRGLQYLITDSWEAGAQNWTDGMFERFAQRRGYDLRPWLPVLTGRVVESVAASESFLWDFRRTIGDLIADEHYGQISESLSARGMGRYGEAHEKGRVLVADGMEVKKSATVPMGAMWTTPHPLAPSPNVWDADVRESASVAHLYGQNLVAAESLTAFGSAHASVPETMKPTVDRLLANGVNRFVIHASVHQPVDTPGPGVSLGLFGQYFTRHETWAEQAGPWVTYLARSSHLLQQGRFVADVIYYYGQDSNITALYGKALPAVPEGYAFDFASAHALTKLSVRDGALVTDSGMRYRVLALDARTKLMSLDVLKQIAQLVEAGATVIGAKPQATPSLADDGQAFQALADAVWGSDAAQEHRYGRGRVLSQSLADALADVKLEPDFSYSKSAPDTTLWFVHRRLADGDLYFINNRQAREERIEGRFRVTGKAPELWHADTGAIEPVSYRMEGNRTIVPLKLDAHDAVFVVFRKNTQQRDRQVSEPIRQPLGAVRGPWKVRFQSGRGAPEKATFAELKSWTAHSDSGIKYFSGTASYETRLVVRESWLVKDQRVEIDLGVVKNLAEIRVNGRSAGIVWKAPFRIDITPLLRPGVNRLDVRVTNPWLNRLIGDKQPGTRPVAFATYSPYSADSPLADSGLLGPVTVLRNFTPVTP